MIKKKYLLFFVLIFFLLFNFLLSWSVQGADSPFATYYFSGNANDSSGNGLDGTVYNSPDMNKGYLELNGANQWVDLPDNNNFSLGDSVTDSPFSMEAWIYMKDSVLFPIAEKGSVGGSNEWRFWLDTNSKLNVQLYDGDTTNYISRYYDTSLSAYENQWIHIAMTYDGSAAITGIKVYLNGVQVDDTSDTLGNYIASHNSTADVRIGRWQTAYADGYIDQVSFYQDELNSTEIQDLYDNLYDQFNDKEIDIKGTVDPTLTMVIVETDSDLPTINCDLGVLTADEINTCSYRTKITTNGTNGYIAYIRETGEVLSAAGDSIANTDGTINQGTAEYGVATTDFFTGQGIGQMTDEDGNLTVETADCTYIPGNVINSDFTSIDGSDLSFAKSTGAVSDEYITLCHGASIATDTPAGVYTHTVEITVVGNF